VHTARDSHNTLAVDLTFASVRLNTTTITIWHRNRVMGPPTKGVPSKTVPVDILARLCTPLNCSNTQECSRAGN